MERNYAFLFDLFAAEMLYAFDIALTSATSNVFVIISRCLTNSEANWNVNRGSLFMREMVLAG